MRPIFEPEHEGFRESLRGTLRDVLEPRADQCRADRAIAREVWTHLGALGFLGFMAPERFGGSDVRDFRYNAVLGEELALVGLAFASSIGINTDVVAPYLLDLTSESQKQRWLPDFCAGRLITAIGMTEPNAGSDLAALRTSARRDGDGWRLNGSKTFITNGYHADLVVVAARTAPGTGSRGITLFAVPSGTPGFERGRKLDKVGQPEADTAELFFDDVRLTPEEQLGDLDQGFQHMMARLPQERLACAVACLSHAESAFTGTLEYTGSRVAFGRPIGDFQHNRFTLAALRTEIDVTQAFVDQCIVAHVAGRLDPVAAAKAKYWASEVQNRVVDACVQLHGGYGYMLESPIARAWLDARVTRIWAGTNEIMREVIGRTLTQAR